MNTIFRYILGVLAIFVISLGIFYLALSPPMSELRLMALFLAITALVSSLAGYLAYRLGWIALTPSLRWGLMAIYAISSILTFFNVWFSARLMFASEHDLLLASVLLVFAGGMAMALGYFLSSTITDRIQLLKQAAEKLAQGNLETRVPVSGRDEIAALAESFNQMASQLQAADIKQHELERLRTDLIAWVRAMTCRLRWPPCAPFWRLFRMGWWKSLKPSSVISILPSMTCVRFRP